MGNQAPIAGVVAAEITGRDWFTHQSKISYSQPLLLGQSYDAVEAEAGCLW